MLLGVIFCASHNNIANALGKEITITVCDKEQVYNQMALTLDYILSGDTLTPEELAMLDIVMEKEEGARVGDYNITASYNATTGITVSVVDGTYTIIPATFDTRDLFFENKTFTYNGMSRNIFVEGFLPSEINVIYASNNQKQAGEYLVSAIFNGSSNYNIIGGTLYATLSIEKAIIDISGMSFVDGIFTYDGMPKSLQVMGSIPDNVSIRYQGNLAQAAGSYRSTAIIDYDKNNYRLFNGEYEMVKNSLYADIVINKARSIISVEKNLYQKMYDGTPFTIPATVVGEDSRNIVYIINSQLGSNKFIDVGNYRVVLTTIGNNNYLSAEEKVVEVKILTPFIALRQQNFDITLLSATGFEDGTTILITKSDSAMIDTKQNPFQRISAVYTILLFCSGTLKEVPANTTVVITPPNGRNLNLFFNNSGQGESIEYTYNGQNNIVFQTNQLGMFVIYQDDDQLYWIIGLFICIIGMLALLIVIAIYRSKRYKVDFVSNIIGYSVETISAGIGQDITIPDANFGSLIFDGWYLDDTLKNKLVSLDTMPKMDIKLYAKWSYRPIGKYRKFTDLDLF